MFENMDYIYEVYKEGSFSKAARNLFISQPSLSASVKRIEEKLGYPIFDRSTKPLRLTDFGERYVEAMLAIKAIEKNFAEYANDYGELKTGSVKIGGTNLVTSLIAPGLITTFHEKYPHISIDLVEGATPDLEELLSDGTLDMVIDYSLPSYENYDYLKLCDEDLVLTVPKKYPINEKLRDYAVDINDIREDSAKYRNAAPVPLEEFREVPFVLLKKKNDTFIRAHKLLSEAGFDPIRSFEAAQQMTAYHVCYSGLGAAFVSSILLKRVTADPNVVFYRLDSPLARRQLCIYWKKERYYTRTMKEFCSFAVSELKEL